MHIQLRALGCHVFFPQWSKCAAYMNKYVPRTYFVFYVRIFGAIRGVFIHICHPGSLWFRNEEESRFKALLENCVAEGARI